MPKRVFQVKRNIVVEGEKSERAVGAPVFPVSKWSSNRAITVGLALVALLLFLILMFK